MKILITGGHLTPALALIEYLQRYQPTQELVFVGRRFSQESRGQLSREAAEMQARQVPYFELHAVKLHESAWLQLGLATPRFIGSLKQAFTILGQVRPDVVMSFGGYVAVPIALAAAAMRIPVVTHEQTTALGLANRIISQIAVKTLLTYSQTAGISLSSKTQVVGNLTRDELISQPATKPKWLDSKLHKPLLLVTGGSQGSMIINNTISPMVESLAQNWIVVHQLGPQIQTTDSKSLPDVPNYYPREWLSASELNWLLRQKPVVICRAGANTVHDLSLFDLTAIFIPLPTARNKEQHTNAQRYLDQYSGHILPQEQLSQDSLSRLLTQLKPDTLPQATLPSLKSPDPVSRTVFEVLESCHAKI